MRHQHLRAHVAAGARDPQEQPETPALQRAERGEHEGPVVDDAGRVAFERLLGVHRAAQRTHRLQHGGCGFAREVEARHRLRELQRRRQALVDACARRQTEGGRMTRDDFGVRSHEPVVDALAALVHLQARRIGGERPVHHRQGHPRLAVDRQRAGDGDERQPQMRRDQATRRLHLIGDDDIDAQRTQPPGGLAAKHVGGLGHVADHAAQTRRPPGTGGARDDAVERTGRMGRRAQRMEFDVGAADQCTDIGLVQPADAMSP